MGILLDILISGALRPQELRTFREVLKNIKSQIMGIKILRRYYPDTTQILRSYSLVKTIGTIFLIINT